MRVNDRMMSGDMGSWFCGLWISMLYKSFGVPWR